MSTSRGKGLGRDTRWVIGWAGALAVLTIWDLAFLNRPALRRVGTGALNTALIALLTVTLSLVVSWAVTNLMHALERRQRTVPYMTLVFLLNLIRSVPQILGVLFGYIGIAALVDNGAITSRFLIFAIMSMCMSLFMVNEMVDLMRERIAHFMKSDFYSAMLVCGIPERRIVNRDILWKNSRAHIFNKLISVFGMAVFLQCSVDFVISVGLSSNVNAVNLPPTLGSVLAHIESKQDILAVSHTLTHPSYISNLFFGHLQGLTTALLISLSLLAIHNIANGFAERHKL